MIRSPLQHSSEVTNGTAEVLTAAAASHTTYGFPVPILPVEFNFRVTTAVLAGTVAPAVSIRKLLITDDSTATEIAVITVPTGAAIGNLYYNDLEANAVSETTRRLLAGQRLDFYHKTAATDPGTPTGAGHYGLVYLVEHKTANRASHETARAA